MWGLVVLFLGMIFHTRSGKQKRKSSHSRKFYKHGFMREEVEALDALHEGFEMQERFDKRKRK